MILTVDEHWVCKEMIGDKRLVVAALCRFENIGLPCDARGDSSLQKWNGLADREA